MLSKDSRLRLSEIACRVRLNRKVTLMERIWVQKLIEHNNSARGIYERIVGGKGQDCI